MTSHPIVSPEEWLPARQALLAKEKEFSRQRDALSAARRDLPWVKVEKPYVFDGPNGKETLADLFAGRSQLIVYHFMFGPDWKEGCPSCSLLADHFDGSVIHLAHRDATLIVASRAQRPKIEAYQKRMGWRFKWVSSHGSDFNRDYQVTHTENELSGGGAYYNYKNKGWTAGDEAPGVSVFTRNQAGDVFHTYSSYARGLDMLIGAYNFLDLVPKGRGEAGLSYKMEWVRRHDQYKD